VAGVAADDEEIALAACRAIDVEYEELTPFLKPETSLEEIPDKLKLHRETRHPSNLQKEVNQQFGDVDQALASSPHVARGDFRFIGVTHAFTEPHCVIAHHEPTGRLTIWSATQVPHYLHRDLAAVMEMPMHRIRVIRPMVGGAFGGKSDPFPHEMIAALLSRKTGRPVKIRFDREEVFLSNHGRHPTKTKMTVGCTDEGQLTGLDLDVLIDGGAWGSFGVVTTYYNGVLSVGPYRFENFRYRGRRVYTNKPPCGAMRGHGAVNCQHAGREHDDPERLPYYLERYGGVHSPRRRSVGLEGEAGRAPARRGDRDRLRLLHFRLRAAHQLEQDSAIDGPFEDRHGRWRHRSLPGGGDRARIGHDAGSMRGRSAGASHRLDPGLRP
jgi:CO/xanthine dehydrogenase Mo-binding subunit